MKPTPQVSSTQRQWRNFPLTDYQFQSTADVHATVPGTQKESRPELRTFRKLSTEFLSAEANRYYLTELLLFTLITAVSAWPIVSAIVAMTYLLRSS